uniref:Putative membrane protein n=1 Tax=Streptomyces aizunensis TaxID=255848 RepID=Q52V73_9ACTN|nr:putative membrane protein [Streptomyces aizunensis]
MSPFLNTLIASGTILAVILSTDLGTRKVTTTRMLPSLLAVVVILALLVHTLPLDGNDPSLQLAGIGAGIICGLAATALLPAHRNASGEVSTKGGIGYALVWTALSASRVLFAYGSQHWFSEGIVRFSTDYKLSGQAVYSNAFAFMALAMVLTRTAVLLNTRRRLRGGQLPAADNTAPHQASSANTH